MAYDCWELVKFFYLKVFSIDMKLDGYYVNPNNREEVSRLIEIEKNQFTKVDTPEFGDVLVLRIYGQAAHLGIHINDTKILHTQKGTGSILDTYTKWAKRVEGVYRYGKH